MIRSQLLCIAGSDAVPAAEMFALPDAFVDPQILRLGHFERPLILSLAHGGRHGAAAVQQSITHGFNPLLLRGLDLSSSCLTDAEVGSLCIALRGCALLEHLSLAYNALEWQGLRDISQVLPHLHALVSLDLSHNACGGWTHVPAARCACPAQRAQAVPFDARTECMACEGGGAGEGRMRDWRYLDRLARSPPRREGPTAHSWRTRQLLDRGDRGEVELDIERDAPGASVMGDLDRDHRHVGFAFQGIVCLARALMRGRSAGGQGGGVAALGHRGVGRFVGTLNLGCCGLTDASIGVLAGALWGAVGEIMEGGDSEEEREAGGAGLSASCEVLRLHCNDIGEQGAAHLAAAMPSSGISVSVFEYVWRIGRQVQIWGFCRVHIRISA